MKILVADDSKPIRERLVARLVDRPGVQVAEAADTHEALRKLDTFHPDVAVLDIRMPGGGGIKALSRIKKNHPAVIVMIVTNYPYAPYRRKCFDAGADFFFDKSTEFEQVAETVQQLLDGEPSDLLARKTAVAQLVRAKEDLERVEQRRTDMGMLALLGGKDRRRQDDAYAVWARTFDAIPDMVSIFDAQYRIVRVNREMADRLGVPAAELIGKPCYTCMHGSSCPIETCPHQKLQDDHKEHAAEFFEKKLNAWLHVTVSPILQDGELIGVVHVARDVTARRQAEEEARRGGEELRHVMDALSNGIWDWDILSDHITCSPQCYEMLGYQPDEFSLDYSTFEKIIHPDDVPGMEEALRAYFCGESDRYNVELRCRRKDESYAWIRVRGSLLARTPEGEPARMMGVLADITRTRCVEQALKDSEAQYRQLFSAMSAAFALHEIICDESGNPCDYRFLEVNQSFEEMTGLCAEKIIGLRIREVLPTTEKMWIERYGRVALTGEPDRFEAFSGSLGRWFSVSAYSPRKGRVAAIFHDVTEQKIAQESIREALKASKDAHRLKNQFLANMSHELRTPLNAIIGLNELLADTDLNEEQRDYVETVSNSSEALLKIISDLFDLSRLELGRLQTARECFEVRDFIRETVAQVEPEAAGKHIALSTQIEPDVPGQVTSDPHRLRQTLVNLLQNAVKFTEEGTVRLTVRTVCTPSESRRLEFAVQDDGPGMDEQTLTYIFEPFRQGDASSTREHGGAGLGLAISRNLARLLGGSLTVQSRPGSGSIFRLSLPFQASGEHTPVSPQDVEPIWRGRSICIWDDDPADLRAAEHLLESFGIRLRYADTVDLIRARLTEEIPPDAVLLNLDMPGLIDELPAFRAIHPDVPWIGFSHWGFDPDESCKAFFAGFADRPLMKEQIARVLLKLGGRLRPESGEES